MEKLIRIKNIEIKKTLVVGQEVKLLNDSLIKQLAYYYPKYITNYQKLNVFFICCLVGYKETVYLLSTLLQFCV